MSKNEINFIRSIRIIITRTSQILKKFYQYIKMIYKCFRQQLQIVIQSKLVPFLLFVRKIVEKINYNSRTILMVFFFYADSPVAYFIRLSN